MTADKWTLSACLGREAKYRATLAKIPGGEPTQTDEDRRQILALVDRMLIVARAGLTECRHCQALVQLARELDAGGEGRE